MTDHFILLEFMFETLVWIISLYLFPETFIIFQRTGEEGVVFTSTQFQLGKMNISRDGWWRWIHNSGNARTAIERHTLKWLKPYKKVIHIKRLYKRLCSFYSNKILAMFSVLLKDTSKSKCIISITESLFFTPEI